MRGRMPYTSPSRWPIWYQSAVRHSLSLICAQPEAARTRLIHAAVDRAALMFIVALLPAPAVVHRIQGCALLFTQRSPDAVLRLQAVHCITEAGLVGVPALARRDGGAASQPCDSYRNDEEPHARANSPRRALFRTVYLLLLAGVDPCGAAEVLVDARHALHLALGRETLVEAFLAELLGHLGPRRQALLP